MQIEYDKDTIHFLTENKDEGDALMGIGIKYDKVKNLVIVNGWYDGNCSLGEEIMTVDIFIRKLGSIGLYFQGREVAK